ncbi:MAG TPA: 30S ribosomal protein S5 [Thermotogae bacterium]|nr:30S ribosomal protein S5 [Thermotogota bacterium]
MDIESIIEVEEFEERVLEIRRVTKVVKGGKNLSFRAVAVVGNKNGKVGVGVGDAREVPAAIRKAITDARRNMIEVPVIKGTIPHDVVGRQDASKVVLKPAAPGTGIIASAAVRAVVELAGIKNILTKSLGSTTPLNLARATFNGLKELKSLKEYAELRDLSVSQLIKGAREGQQ